MSQQYPIRISKRTPSSNNDYLLLFQQFIEFSGKWLKYLMRGDADGRITLWKIPDTPECASMQLKTENGETMSVLKPAKVTSLNEIWTDLNPKPAGVLNQLLENLDTDPALTATIFLPMQCRLVCGREDGSIILVSLIFRLRAIVSSLPNYLLVFGPPKAIDF